MVPMKILINQQYGLGNQFFQYAAGLYFAKRHGASLEIIREEDKNAVSRGHPRPFLLDKFNISTPVRSRTVLDRVLRSESPVVERLAGGFRRLYGSETVQLFSKVGEFFPALPTDGRTRRVYLGGHFQVRQYAEATEEQVRREFTFREPPTGKNREMMERIQDAECAVSLHFRRGDYALWWKGQNLLPMVYYENAMAGIREVCAKPTFFVFSDDIESARESCRGLESAVFVDHNGEDSPHEDVRLISSCKHHILANSTLSWWGAWLNTSPGKIVMAPAPWHMTDPHPNLIPKGWREVPSQTPADASTVGPQE
jgi:hypothetical protein